MKTNYRLIILEQGNIIVSDEKIYKDQLFYAMDRCSIHKNEWVNPISLKEEFPFYCKIMSSDKIVKIL